MSQSQEVLKEKQFWSNLSTHFTFVLLSFIVVYGPLITDAATCEHLGMAKVCRQKVLLKYIVVYIT